MNQPNRNFAPQLGLAGTHTKTARPWSVPVSDCSMRTPFGTMFCLILRDGCKRGFSWALRALAQMEAPRPSLFPMGALHSLFLRATNRKRDLRHHTISATVPGRRSERRTGDKR